MTTRVSGEPARKWGPAIVGFGRRRLRDAKGLVLDSLLVGVAPRNAAAIPRRWLGDGPPTTPGLSDSLVGARSEPLVLLRFRAAAAYGADIAHLLVLAGAAVVLAAVGILAFTRRDLRG
ncbi:MAG: hypothetical protein ACR2JU_16490 [Nocardioidaceae bacterium]